MFKSSWLENKNELHALIPLQRFSSLDAKIMHEEVRIELQNMHISLEFLLGEICVLIDGEAYVVVYLVSEIVDELGIAFLTDDIEHIYQFLECYDVTGQLIRFKDKYGILTTEPIDRCILEEYFMSSHVVHIPSINVLAQDAKKQLIILREE